MAQDRVLIDVVARDLAAATIRTLQQEIQRLGSVSDTASREAERGFDRLTDAARTSATRTTDLWQDAAGHWRNSLGQFATRAEQEMAGIPEAARSAARGVDRATEDMGGSADGLASKLRGLAGLMAATFAVDKLRDFATDAINQASDIQEASTKLEAVFGSGTDAVNQFAAQGAKALGQTGLEVKNAAATFGVFGKAAGLAGEENAKFSTDLVGLSTDLASFYNEDPSAVVEALGAGLRGEAEPLRRFGILMDDATLKNKALSMGLITNTKDALEPQQKVLAAQALIMEQTSLAQGDFARTSGGLANQQRILAATWGDMKGQLGEAFLPGVTAVVTLLNDKFMPMLSTAAAAVPEFMGKAKAAVDILRTGEYPGAAAGIGEEDSWLVDKLFDARDAWFTVKGALTAAAEILLHGEFPGFAATGFEEDSPFVDFLFTLRDFGLDTFDRLSGIWDTLAQTGKDLWPSLKSIGESLGIAVLSFKDSGFDVAGVVWEALLSAAEGLAEVLQATLVPMFERVATFMRENPQIVQLAVGAFLTYKGILLAVTVAAKGYAIAQAIATGAVDLFNKVLNMNPLMKIVLLITALVGALIWAYNNVDWFREMVDTAWTWIKEKTTWLWENILQPIFGWIAENIHYVGDAASWLWNEIIVPAWNGISSVISWVWENVIGPYLEAWWFAIDKIGTVVNWLWNEVIVPVWENAIGPSISWVWENIIKPAWEGIQSFFNGIGDFFGGVKSAVEDAQKWISETIDKITSAIETFMGKAFGGGETESGGMNTNLGAATLDESQREDPALAWVQAVGTGGMAEGGPVSGPGGPRADRVWRRLSPGEYVVNADAASRNMGLLNAVNYGMAEGGLVQAAYDKAYRAITGYAGPLLDEKKTAVMSVGSGVGLGVGDFGAFTGNFTGGVEQWRSTVLLALAMKGLPAAYADRVLMQMQSESGGNPNSINLWDSNAQKGTPSMGLLQTILPTYNAYADPRRNLGPYDPLSNILASLGYAIARYGSLEGAYRGVAYDNGGLFKNNTLGVNTSGRTEAVLTGDETKAYQAHAKHLANGGGAKYVTIAAGAVQINVNGPGDPVAIRAELEQALRDILADDAARSM